MQGGNVALHVYLFPYFTSVLFLNPIFQGDIVSINNSDLSAIGNYNISDTFKGVNLCKWNNTFHGHLLFSMSLYITAKQKPINPSAESINWLSGCTEPYNNSTSAPLRGDKGLSCHSPSNNRIRIMSTQKVVYLKCT